jgi:hypothetical protein
MFAADSQILNNLKSVNLRQNLKEYFQFRFLFFCQNYRENHKSEKANHAYKK